jgi:hypothetical protein
MELQRHSAGDRRAKNNKYFTTILLLFCTTKIRSFSYYVIALNANSRDMK